MAGVAPHRRPLVRAARWDGVVPLGAEGVLTPQELADYLALVTDRPAEWDVVVARAAGVPAGDYAAAGATWLVEGSWPGDGWLDELRTAIRGGPPS